MDSYSPELILGVTHLPKYIEGVWDILRPYVEKGTKVGLEPYSIPVDTVYWHPKHAAFFNDLGKLITDAGGECAPLSTLEQTKAVREAYEMMKDELGVLLDYLKKSLNMTLYENVSKYDYMARLISESLIRKYGLEEVWRNTNLKEIEITMQEQPRCVVIGQMHTPNFIVNFPRADLILYPIIDVEELMVA